MKTIISPAKKMIVNQESFLAKTRPDFLEQAEILADFLKNQEAGRLKQIWEASDKIVQEGIMQLKNMDLEKAQTPAIISYGGIQYQYMAPDLFTEPALIYIQKNLRILSGLYGVLRPFDAVSPYRLELKNKLVGFKDYSLYHFWDSLIHDKLFEDDDTVINLASKEYAKAVIPYLHEGERFITIDFLEKRKDQWKMIGTHAKMSRGEMVRWISENQIKTPEELQAFNDFDYKFDELTSSADKYIFKTQYDFKRH